MIIPVPDSAEVSSASREWTELAPEAKGQRLLTAAAKVFTQRGLEAPMSEVAAAAGAGVASVYRRFPSKLELLAALVIRRLDQIADAARNAQRSEGDRWSALTGMLRTLVQRQAADDFLGEALIAVAGLPDVEAAAEGATEALEGLMAQARGEGRLRQDATTLDLRLLFAATRAAKRIEPDRWPRMLELLIDALESRPDHGEIPT
jgi:AcrR family transcriptional regulator